MADEVDPIANMSAVVVDDSRNFLKLVRSILRNFGLKDCVCFDDALEALAYLEIHPVDCVIMDLIMPKMNGFELAHKIRHSTEIPNRLIPIVMVTGHANRANINKAINSGIDEVLVKPFRPVDLQKRLHAIATNPRRYIHTVQGYAGPERRRDRENGFFGPDRRKQDDASRIDRVTGQPERSRADYFTATIKRDAGTKPGMAAPAPKERIKKPAASDVYTVKRSFDVPERKPEFKKPPTPEPKPKSRDKMREVWEL